MSSVSSEKKERDLFLIKPVDFKLAELHNQASLVRDISDSAKNPEFICKCCSLSTESPLFDLNTNLVNLGQLGVGFPLFFYTVKFFMISLFLGFLVCGLPCVIDNLTTSASTKQKNTNFASKTSLHKGKDKIWQGIIMFILLLLIIIFFILYRRFVRNQVVEVDKRNNTPSDFAVTVKGLPSDTDFQELKTFMQHNSKPFGCDIEVVDICPSYNISGYVKKAKKLGKLQHKIALYKDYQDKNGKLPEDKILCFSRTAKLEQLEDQVHQLRTWKRQFELSNNLKMEQGSWAFVIFRKQTDTKEIIDYWKEKELEKLSRYLLMCLHKYVYEERTFHGNLISIEPAPEPSDIIWENLTVSSWVRFKKRLKTALATTGVLIISFFIILSIKIYEYEVYIDSGKSHITDEENMRIKAVSLLLSISIVVLNQVIGSTIRYFSRYEKPVTWTEYNVTVFHKLLFSTTVNTVVVLILVNSYDVQYGYAGAKGIDIHWFSQNYGLASDLFNLLLIDIFIIPLIQLFHPKYLFKLYLRRQALNGKLILTQSQANSIWTNPELDIADRSARYVRIYLVVLLFTPLFPIGLLMGACSMFNQYWVDKYLLLRRYTRPKTYGKYLSLAVLRWMPFCLLFFSISNFFIQLESHDLKINYLVAPIIGLSMCFLYFLIPFRMLCGRKSTAESAILYNMSPDENDYQKQLSSFNMDYMRSNPVTSKKGWNDWLQAVQETKGLEARNKMHLLHKHDIDESGIFSYLEGRPTSALLNSSSVVEQQFIKDKSMTWQGLKTDNEALYKPPDFNCGAPKGAQEEPDIKNEEAEGTSNENQLYPNIEPCEVLDHLNPNMTGDAPSVPYQEHLQKNK